MLPRLKINSPKILLYPVGMNKNHTYLLKVNRTDSFLHENGHLGLAQVPLMAPQHLNRICGESLNSVG